MDNDTDTDTLYLIPSSRIQVSTSTESDGSTVVYLSLNYTAEMSTVASSSSSKQMEVNPRGIPKAPFVVCPPASG
jgi:hypothetical protein